MSPSMPTILLGLSVTGAGLVAWAACPAAQGMDGNRANGSSYQPTQTEVRQREDAAGIAPSPRYQRDMDRAVERLNSQLQAEPTPAR